MFRVTIDPGGPSNIDHPKYVIAVEKGVSDADAQKGMVASLHRIIDRFAADWEIGDGMTLSVEIEETASCPELEALLRSKSLRHIGAPQEQIDGRGRGLIIAGENISPDWKPDLSGSD